MQVGETDFTQTMLDKGALFSRCATPSKLNMFNFVNIVFFAFSCHTCKLLCLKAAVFKESRQRWQEAAHLQCGQTREGGLPHYTIPGLGSRLPHYTIPGLTHHTIPRLPHHRLSEVLIVAASKHFESAKGRLTILQGGFFNSSPKVQKRIQYCMRFWTLGEELKKPPCIYFFHI